MIRTLDFNAFAAGTIIDDEYAGVTISACGGSNQAMIFDSSNPTGGDKDLASNTLGGLLIISEDGDSDDPDDNASGGSIFFDFDDAVHMKSITLKDIEECGGQGTRLIYYNENGHVIENQFVQPTGDGGEVTLQLFVPGTYRLEVRFPGSGAVDNVTFDDGCVDGGIGTQDDTAITDEDTPVLIDVLDNDANPEGERLSVTSATSPDGTVTIDDMGMLTFTPTRDFNGPTTISYTVEDSAGNTGAATVNVTVNPINDAPVANDDSATTVAGTPVTIAVLANDTDVDNTAAELTVTVATSPDGTVEINADNTITFTPAGGFTGSATINYTVSDPDGLTDDAVVTVTVGAGDPGLDGIVQGTDGDDLIDLAYTGDPQGDMIDAEDALLPGEDPNDDIVEAGAGDDTVLAGLGNDEVFGGDGNDDIDGEEGDDVLHGEDGDDTLTGGTGNDIVYGGTGNDSIDTSSGDLAPDLPYPFSTSDRLGYVGDTDTENDRDYVDGGAGNDTIRTGDDRDTIFGGEGDDDINAGIDDDIVNGNDGDDRIVGGEGNDLLVGGAGDDTIYGGNDPELGLDILNIPDEDGTGNPFDPDREPFNGRDTIEGGAGNDVIYGADDDDVLSGGLGNDFIDGQVDDDLIDGGAGEDTLIGGQGDDTIRGGQGNDTLQGGIGDDDLNGNQGNDLVEGGDGDDRVDGDGGRDTLRGGEGNDTLIGDGGADLLDGGAGNDIMFGGNDQDTFINGNGGDAVFGGEGGVDLDTLDLRGTAPEGGRLQVTYTSDDREDGFVTFYDSDDNALPDTLVFEEIENVIPCFTPGTLIATPKGERKVEELQVGDRVITRDNGMQEIRWVGAREMTGTDFDRAVHLKPVLIRQGALGNNLPERDMMVSPNHRVLVANDKTALYFEEREVLVAAKHLTGLEGVDVVDVSGTTYVHIMFDQHEVILSDGTWTESFQPGDMSLAGIGSAQRNEILELFPELATQEGIDGYAAARRSLKKHEARLLTK